MNEDETVPFIITVLSQHASKSHTFNGVHYRQSPSAEVKPKVTAQEADERINLSQWEKNRERVCLHEYIYGPWGGNAGIRYCWEARRPGVSRAPRQSYWCCCHRNQGRRAQMHTTHTHTHTKAHLCSPAHTHKHTVIVILRHSRSSVKGLVLLNKKQVFWRIHLDYKRKTPLLATKTVKSDLKWGVSFLCPANTFIALTIARQTVTPHSLKQRVVCSGGRNMKVLVESSLRLIPPEAKTCLRYSSFESPMSPFSCWCS